MNAIRPFGLYAGTGKPTLKQYLNETRLVNGHLEFVTMTTQNMFLKYIRRKIRRSKK